MGYGSGPCQSRCNAAPGPSPQVFFFDTDIVVLRDIYPMFMEAARTGGVLHAAGGVEIGHIEGAPGPAAEGWDYAINYYVNHTNTAFYYMRSNPRTLQLMQNWVACIDRVSRTKADDQVGWPAFAAAGTSKERAARVWLHNSASPVVPPPPPRTRISLWEKIKLYKRKY